MSFGVLDTTWFSLIGLLWAGYLFLEGFDFGVALITPLVSKDEIDRRMCLNSVGPFWDGNEVWLIVAGGATFAAFPLWYARLFSGFYLALFLILLALIARGVSFEFRNKDHRPAWRRTWDWANFFGSLIPPAVWGVAFTNLVVGLPLDSGGVYRGGLAGLLHPIAVLGGAATVALVSFHGANFLLLKTSGGLAHHTRSVAVPLGVAATLLTGAVVLAVALTRGKALPEALPGVVPLAMALAGVAGVAAGTFLVARARDGAAFAATGGSLLLTMGAVFARMFPTVFPDFHHPAHSVTIAAAASGHYTLVVMTIVAAIFTPLVLAYQGWTYWVFRRRLMRPTTGSGATGSA